mmetsp:Transcript_22642/g.57843  ORF Transcript_22642/g.57843 Transcript_22642/m.57843 type:complete len:85 (+) Transcript_22642:58-312(+)
MRVRGFQAAACGRFWVSCWLSGVSGGPGADLHHKSLFFLCFHADCVSACSIMAHSLVVVRPLEQQWGPRSSSGAPGVAAGPPEQ